MTNPGLDEAARLHAIFREARWHRDSVFEKLALLDGGTIALVVTAVLAPLHGNVHHRFLLAAGIACLVVALLALLVRNLLATEIEFYVTQQELQGRVATNPGEKLLPRYLKKFEVTGVVLSWLGILVLAIEACLIVYSHG